MCIGGYIYKDKYTVPNTCTFALKIFSKYIITYMKWHLHVAYKCTGTHTYEHTNNIHVHVFNVYKCVHVYTNSMQLQPVSG